MEWQLIESAPKDGTPVLLWGQWAGEINGIYKVPGMEIGYYTGPSGDYAGFEWAATGGDAYAVWGKPTHWMPLPPPPVPHPA
jgi:hypothetical protein